MIISFMSCTDYEEKIITDIKSEPESYNKLIKTINECDLSRFSYNQHIGKEYFPKILDEAINNTVLRDKVQFLVISKYSDCDQINVELISSRLRVRYEPCPRQEFPKQDSYEEEGLIERWGINSNWMIWKDNDFIY